MSSIGDTIVTYRILKLLSTPIEQSKAFKLGLIDKDGKELKKASNSDERNAYTFLNRFVFKIQRALMKSNDRQARRLLSFAAAVALLRENYTEELDDFEIETLLDINMNDENVIQEAKLLEKNIVSFRTFHEEVAANAVGGGAIHGIGVGPKGEPGRDPVFQPIFRRKKMKKHGNVN